MLQAELTHLEEATATSRFREAELKKAIETAQDTTRALISENVSYMETNHLNVFILKLLP